MELEPMPRAADEDDNEEVGRPEGPHEEWRVDPFAFKAPVAAPEPASEPATVGESAPVARTRPAPVMEPPPVREPEPEPVIEEEPAPEPGPVAEISAFTPEPEERSDVSEDEAEDEGPKYPEVSPPPQQQKAPAPPAWGRRGRRGR